MEILLQVKLPMNSKPKNRIFLLWFVINVCSVYKRFWEYELWFHFHSCFIVIEFECTVGAIHNVHLIENIHTKFSRELTEKIKFFKNLCLLLFRNIDSKHLLIFLVIIWTFLHKYFFWGGQYWLRRLYSLKKNH